MIIRRDHFNELRTGYQALEELADKMVMAEVYNQSNTAIREDLKEPKPVFFKKKTSEHIHCGDICFEPGVYVKKARRMLKERLDKATNRTELVLQHGYDTKFASHLVRLLTEGIALLTEGELKFPLTEVVLLKQIKAGKWKIDEVIQYADELESKLDEALSKSNLPATTRHKEIEQFTIELMKRHLHPNITGIS